VVRNTALGNYAHHGRPRAAGGDNGDLPIGMEFADLEEPIAKKYWQGIGDFAHVNFLYGSKADELS
jgi:hypothetical protein